MDHSGKRKLACIRTKKADLNKWEESGGQSRAIGQMEEEEGIGYLILKLEKRCNNSFTKKEAYKRVSCIQSHRKRQLRKGVSTRFVKVFEKR